MITRIGLLMMLAVFFVCLGCDVDDDDDVFSSDLCRLEPEHCAGGAGALCDDDRDCNVDLFCCDDDKNCGDGMCTASCKDDRDCPFDMLCEHRMCFYQCESDRDCAPGMTCEHDNTICEYD